MLWDIIRNSPVGDGSHHRYEHRSEHGFYNISPQPGKKVRYALMFTDKKNNRTTLGVHDDHVEAKKQAVEHHASVSSQHSEQPVTYTEHLLAGGLPHTYKG